MVTDSIAFIRSSLAVIFMGFLLVIVKRQIGDTSLNRHYKEGTFRNEVVFTLQQNVHKVLHHSFFFFTQCIRGTRPHPEVLNQH